MSAVSIPANDWSPLPEDMHRFLLLDGAQCRGPGDVLRHIPGADCAIRLFDGKLADGSADTSVQLVKLPERVDPAAVMELATNALKSTGAVTFIDTPLEPGELSQRLLRRLDARFPNGKEFLVRFFDGRVLPLLSAVLTPAQRAGFLAVGRDWWYIDADQVWQSASLTAPMIDPYSPPLQLDDAQRRALFSDTYPYYLIDHFTLTDKELLDRVPARDQYRFLRQCMRNGEGYGIHEGKKIAMVCTWALLLGENFHLDPVWQARLSDFATGRRTARDIGNEVWPVEESWE